MSALIIPGRRAFLGSIGAAALLTTKGLKRILTTQLSIRGHEDNPIDAVFKRLKPEEMATIVRDFTPLPESRIGELTVTFDIVLGTTAAEDESGVIRGGIGKKVGLKI